MELSCVYLHVISEISPPNILQWRVVPVIFFSIPKPVESLKPAVGWCVFLFKKSQMPLQQNVSTWNIFNWAFNFIELTRCYGVYEKLFLHLSEQSIALNSVSVVMCWTKLKMLRFQPRRDQDHNVLSHSFCLRPMVRYRLGGGGVDEINCRGTLDEPDSQAFLSED